MTESEKREDILSFKDKEGWQRLCSDPFIYICFLFSFLCFTSYLLPDIMQTNLIFFKLFFFSYVYFEQGCRQTSKSWLTWDPVILPKLTVLLSPCLPMHWSLFWHFQTSACFLQRLTTVLVCICCDKPDSTICFLFCTQVSSTELILDSLSSPGCEKIICFLHLPSELHQLANL